MGEAQSRQETTASGSQAGRHRSGRTDSQTRMEGNLERKRGGRQAQLETKAARLKMTTAENVGEAVSN